MGPDEPLDVRTFLEALGATFGKEDLALCGGSAAGPAVLFVRSSRNTLDLVDTILAGSWDGPRPQVETQFTLKLPKAGGTAEELLRRSILCAGGQPSKFQRSVGKTLLEETAVEASVGEDGKTVDLNAEMTLHLASGVLKATGKALLRSGDSAGIVLYSAPDKETQGTLELSVSAKVSRRPWLENAANRLQENPPERAKTIDTQVRSIMGNAAFAAPRGALYYLPELAWQYVPEDHQQPGDPPKNTTSFTVPCMGNTTLEDATSRLKALQVPLAAGDRALYSRESGLLYVHTGDAGRARLGGLAIQEPHIATQMEVQFTSWHSGPAAGTRTDFLPRSLLVRAGFRAAAERCGEKIEVEGSVRESTRQSELGIALTSFQMGNETWTVNLTAFPLNDPQYPLTIVSGMAKDSGGEMKNLAISSRLRTHHWRELVMDPKRKQKAIEEIEAVLKTASLQ
jgi:hypothetical protein